MQRRKVLKSVGGAGLLFTTGVGTATARGNGRRKGASAEDSIVDIVAASEEFSTLFDAVEAADSVVVNNHGSGDPWLLLFPQPTS